MLLNECAVIVRGDQQIYLAGIDDAHHFDAAIAQQGQPSRRGGKVNF
jgi:hypothetical protein